MQDEGQTAVGQAQAGDGGGSMRVHTPTACSLWLQAALVIEYHLEGALSRSLMMSKGHFKCRL